MSDETTGSQSAEPVFGQAALERDAGYRPMKDQRKEDKAAAEEITPREAAARLAENEPKPDTITYSYPDAHDRETITIEQAASDMSALRQAQSEREAKEEADKLAAEVDKLRGEDKPAKQPKADATDTADGARPASEGQDHFDELERTLQNPHVKEVLSKQIADNEAARETLTQATQQAAMIVEHSIAAQFPEFVNATGDQCLQILAHMQQQNPQRFATFMSVANNAKALIAQQQALQSQSAQRQQEAFRAYATEQDAAFEKSNPFADLPASQRVQLADTIAEGFKEYGIDAAEFDRMYRADKTLRHAGFQRMMIDAARYRLMQKSAKDAAKPRASVPHVVRPGTAAARGNFEYQLAQSAEKRFDAAPTLKNAVALMTAKRRG